MKKLMIAAAIVCAAVAGQAASITWGSGAMTASKDAKGTGGGAAINGTATQWVWLLTDSEYDTVKNYSVTELYKAYASKAASAVVTSGQAVTAFGVTTTKSGMPNGADDNVQHQYSLWMVIDTNTAASYDTVDAFVKAQVIANEWKDTTGPKNTALGGVQANWTAIESVPEPTSGLLLLLGVAGLALRRRRA